MFQLRIHEVPPFQQPKSSIIPVYWYPEQKGLNKLIAILYSLPLQLLFHHLSLLKGHSLM